MAEYGNETPKYTLRSPALGDYISPNEEQRTAQIIENQLYGAIRVHSGGHGIMRSGNWQVLADGSDYQAVLAEVKAEGKPAIEGFINQVYFHSNDSLAWTGLTNNTTYYLYVQLVESDTISTRLHKKVQTGSNTTGLIPDDALLVAVLYLDEPSSSIVEKNPVGRINIYSLGDHIADNKDPHGPFLNQSFITCSGIDVAGYIHYRSLQVDQEIVSGNSVLSGTLQVLGNLLISGNLYVQGTVTYNNLNIQNLNVPTRLTVGNLQVNSGLDVYSQAVFRQNITLTSGVRIDGFDPSVGIGLVNGANADHLHTHVVGSLGTNLKAIYLSPEYKNTVLSGAPAITTLSGVFQPARAYDDNYYSWYGSATGVVATLVSKVRLPVDFDRLDRLVVRTGIGNTLSGNNVSISLYDKNGTFVPPTSAFQFSTTTLTDQTMTFSGGALVGGYPLTIMSRMCGASGIATMLGDLALWYVPTTGERLQFSWDQGGAISAPTETFDALRTTPYELRIDSVMATQAIGLSGTSIFAIKITSGSAVIPFDILSGTEKPNLSFGTVGAQYQTVRKIILNRTIPANSIIECSIDSIASGSSDVSVQLLTYRV